LPPPAVDGAGAGEQDGGNDRPRLALVQQQQDVGAQAKLGVASLAVEIPEGIAVAWTKRDTTRHGLASEVLRLVVAPFTLDQAFLPFKTSCNRWYHCHVREELSSRRSGTFASVASGWSGDAENDSSSDRDQK
jgi:hypothetical protein